LGLLGILGLALAGCYPALHHGTPEDALQSVVSLARYGRAGDTPKVMTGPALEAFGTKKGLADLHEKLSKVVAMDPPQLIRSDQGDQGNGRYGDVRRVFTVDVAGRTRTGDPAEYRALLVCGVSYWIWEQDDTTGRCYPDEKRPAGVRCSPGKSGYSWDAELQDCRVSDITAKAD
jgi:hypothetical protein